jgi:hypothetical protein
MREGVDAPGGRGTLQEISKARAERPASNPSA